MLSLFGKSSRSCDGVSRRDFLKVGTLGMGGLTLADLLRLKAQGAIDGRKSYKAVIMLFLQGGPSHIDMYDMKPSASAEFRGEFKPIQTNVPGLEICEHMPQQTKIADKLTIVRNIFFGDFLNHDIAGYLSGFQHDLPGIKPVRRPDFGSVISKLHDNGSGLPPFVQMGFKGLDPSYLGKSCEAFSAGGDDDLAFTAHTRVKNLGLHPSTDLDRLAERKELLARFDSIRHDLDSGGSFSDMDAFSARALDIISSSKVRDAFDIAKEPERVRTQYRSGLGRQCLLARRLVEAGVAVVTICSNKWDTHYGNFKQLREFLPPLDHAIATLVGDLHERGLDKDVLLLVGGEFGRAPRIGRQVSPGSVGADGRDHWSAGFVLFAGGGLQMGQVIGDTGPRGEGDTNKRYNLQNLHATLYHLFGVNTRQVFKDQTGRPHDLLEEHGKIDELL